MPIFEFQCQKCGEPFDELVRSAAAIDEVSCPKCGSARVKKKLSTFATKVSGGTRGSSASASACAPGSV